MNQCKQYRLFNRLVQNHGNCIDYIRNRVYESMRKVLVIVYLHFSYVTDTVAMGLYIYVLKNQHLLLHWFMYMFVERSIFSVDFIYILAYSIFSFVVIITLGFASYISKNIISRINTLKSTMNNVAPLVRTSASWDDGTTREWTSRMSGEDSGKLAGT